MSEQTLELTTFDLSSFAEWLLINGKRGGHSQKSIAAYCSDLRGFMQWFNGHTGQSFAPELVIPQDLRAYDHFSNEIQHVRAATWNRRFNALAAFFQFATQEGLIVSNPFNKSGLRTRSVQEAPPKSLNKSDYARVLRVVEQSVNVSRTGNQRRMAIRNRAMFALLVYAGVRVGELCELRPANLLLSDRKGHVAVEHGKGDKEGDVPLAREARLAIADWLQINPDEVLFDGLTSRQVQRIIADYGQRAGVQLTPHMLRHTFVYRALEMSGGNLALVKDLARHNRIDQTARYAKPHREDLEAAVENL
jgi:integrase/recombinase XerC